MRTVLARALAPAVFGVAIGCISGCNTTALSKQEMVAHFAPTAPQADHSSALAACGHVSPRITPEPMTTSRLPSDHVGNVRFRTDHADDRDLALLTECLNRQPGVAYVEIPDPTG